MTLDSPKQLGRTPGRTAGLSVRYYEDMMMFLLGLFVFFNTIDLLSTSFALNVGLSEGNLLLIGSAQLSGLGIITFMLLTKIVFLSGGIGLGFVGMRSANRQTRNVIMWGIVAFVALFAYVAANNLYIILVTGIAH